MNPVKIHQNLTDKYGVMTVVFENSTVCIPLVQYGAVVLGSDGKAMAYHSLEACREFLLSIQSLEQAKGVAVDYKTTPAHLWITKAMEPEANPSPSKDSPVDLKQTKVPKVVSSRLKRSMVPKVVVDLSRKAVVASKKTKGKNS
jgi:hypothetical protein